MDLEFVKAEEGLCGGRVLYHKYVHKSAEEAAAQEDDVEARRHARAERRRQQVWLGWMAW